MAHPSLKQRRLHLPRNQWDGYLEENHVLTSTMRGCVSTMRFFELTSDWGTLDVSIKEVMTDSRRPIGITICLDSPM
eukprot:70828-Alexandrium_andersonii.AAC.1